MENENTVGEAIPSTSTEHVIAGVIFEADGWVKETFFHRIFPSVLMTGYFCGAAIAIFAGLY